MLIHIVLFNFYSYSFNYFESSKIWLPSAMCRTAVVSIKLIYCINSIMCMALSSSRLVFER
jgi:hypothetical protein